jgi:hypothetical protein
MIRAFQWDLARQVERLDWLLAQLPRYADWGYQELHLHLEDAVEYPSLPFVARKDAYSYRQFGRLVEAATNVGIKVVPIVNLLGHTQYLIKTPELRDLNELRADDGSPRERGQICPLHPRTLEIAEKLLRDMAPFCTAGKVHAGLDESFHLGEHPLSQKEVAEIGLAAHFANYVHRLHELTNSLRLEFNMWADMLYFLPEAIPLLPSKITAYEWYYHAFRRLPRVEMFNFAEVDVAIPLRERGISLYGCPMNGAFRYEPLPHFSDRLANIRSWWAYAHKIHASGFLVSSWESSWLAPELTTVIDAAAASLWLEPEISSSAEMLTRGFARAFGKQHAAAAKLALACDRFPFTGYTRWEINDRWDVISRRESLASYRREKRYFTALASKARQLRAPISLRASIELRRYLAQRDVWVRETSNASARSNRSGEDRKPVVHPKEFITALNQGLGAARTMWRRTRDAHERGPNENRLLSDAARLKAFARGEPVFGGEWQLCYSVKNFAPASQRVSVEQLQPDGTWKTLQACHTIEFQTAYAHPRSSVVREHAAPVEWNGAPTALPKLRFALTGIGQVKIGRVELRRGGKTLLTKSPRGWFILGARAAKSGWPDPSRVITRAIKFPGRNR